VVGATAAAPGVPTIGSGGGSVAKSAPAAVRVPDADCATTRQW
jgi:hypothetical protein